MEESVIFKPSEIRALNRRFNGDKHDPAGIYAGRVKPKLIELLKLFEQKEHLEELMGIKKETVKNKMTQKTIKQMNMMHVAMNLKIVYNKKREFIRFDLD